MRHHAYLFMLIVFCVFNGRSQTGVGVSQLQNCDNLVQNFLNNYNIPGASLAISKSGKLIYMKGFGHADLAKTDSVYPHHLFRIASVSKPITGIAIMKLVENGQLSLSDTVFGSKGILANHSYINSATITDNRFYDITVQQLLEHSGGWDRDIPCISGNATPYLYQPSHCDPIAFPRHVTHSLGEPDPVTKEMHIRFLLEKGLNHDPGTSYHYSNIGYLVLGIIIEEITGLTYEDYVKTNILSQLDICDMHIGKSLLADKLEREMEYQGNGYTSLSAFGGSQNVPWEYGGWVLEAMDAHGGWIATPRDLVRLILAVDGFANKPDILSSASITTMTTGSPVNSGYALGWQVNSFNNWWHTGALDGTASIIVRSANGYTWAFLLNKRILGTSNFWSDLDNLPWNCISGLGATGVTDYLNKPSQGSSNLVISQNSSGANTFDATLMWTAGDGDRRLVTIRPTHQMRSFPVDGRTYSNGSMLGGTELVMYDGTGTTANATGLANDSVYVVEIYEYNQNVTTNQEAIYDLCRVYSDTIYPIGFSLDSYLSEITISPNPVESQLFLNTKQPYFGQLEIVELTGKLVHRKNISGQSQIEIDVQHLKPGMYILRAVNSGHNHHLQFLKN